MRILANFTKKVCTGQYENETFCISVEMDTDMSLTMISDTADALFAEAKAAVERQIQGNAATTTPANVTPIKPDMEKEAPAESKPTKPAGNTLLPTEKQLNMVKKLLRENFKDAAEAKRWMIQKFNVDATTQMSRRICSKVIDALLDKSRKIA